VVTGVVAGVCGVVVVRSLVGPHTVLGVVLAGLVALLAGTVLSWSVSGRQDRRRRRAREGRLRRRVHPVAWFTPVVGTTVAVLAWAGVAHSSGSGWVQAVGALLAAVLFTGLVAPLVPARRASVTCAASPSDTEAGQSVTLSMTANGPIRIRPRRPAGAVARAGGSPRGPRSVEVTVTPERRGVLESVSMELASCAPFGLLWWAKEVDVPLPRPLHVAPRYGRAGEVTTRPDDSAGDAPLRVPSGAGEPRGIRPYQPGDTRRAVHWPATSHVGSLMVRERERQTEDPVVIDVLLPPDPAEAEAESERVMAAAHRCLIRGQPVVLGTQEPDGHVMRVVRDRIDLGRRLARAVPSSPVPPPSGTSPTGRQPGRARS
jgi:uncharacterized protein (DUF58 family)